MIEVHLRALEAILRGALDAKELKTIDHWNNNYSQQDKNNPLFPAVFFDFGHIEWKPMVGDTYQTGRATITAHCMNTSYRETRDKANDADGKRLKRFDWSQRIMNTLNGCAAKDKFGNVIFNRVMLAGCQFDTNHAALFDDTLMFNCQVFYYSQWMGEQCGDIFTLGAPVYDSTVSV